MCRKKPWLVDFEMESMRFIFWSCFLLCARCAERKSYTNYKVIDVHTPNPEDVVYMGQLMTTRLEMNFWNQPSHSQPCKFAVAPENFDQMINLLSKRKLSYKVVDENLQLAVDREWEEIQKLKEAADGKFDVNNFNEIDEIYNWLDSLVEKCPNSFTCQVYSIGKSYLGKPIKAFKITKAGAERKVWYIDATTHAREWITTATITKLIDHLVSVRDKDAQTFLEKYDWHFVPVVNPDGYEYSWNTDRFWRKNRHSFKKCVGVDLNRNFNSTNWGTNGTSSSECSDSYKGPSAGSEEETKAVSNELRRLSSRTIVAFTMHSFGNMFLVPYGNTDNNKKCFRCQDHDEIMVAVNAAADATQATHGTVWKRGNACEVIYPTSGSTDDYAKDLKIKYSICPELRGNGFVVNPEEIPLSFKEIYNGLVALEKFV